MTTQHHAPLGADELARASAPRKGAQIVGNQGTAPSNTVPSNSTEDSHTRILRTGIDTLYLSYSGELFQEQGIRLANLKELAQSPDPERQALAQLELATHTFEVGDKV